MEHGAGQSMAGMILAAAEAGASSHSSLLQDLAIVMIVAGLVTIIFRQLNQPVVLGYILAGVIIGPHTPPFALIDQEHTIETLAELGIIFLMFSLGLEFSLGKLRKVGPTAFIVAAFEILVMILIGYELGRAFGWGQMDSIFLGAILAISSTTIIIKALEGLGKTKEPFSRVIFGILIVEDILAIVLLALLTGFAMTGQIEPGAVGMTILQLCSFLGILMVGGLIFVPRLLNYIARFQSDEMLLVTVTGLCFGVSLLTVKLGYSVALGAFLIGAIIAESRQIIRIETLMHPVRDLFSAVFFVSIGLLIDPKLLAEHAIPVVVLSIAVIVGKVFACSLGTLVAGNDTRTSLHVGMGLAQIGEFSFIIASLGLSLKVTSEFLYPIAVAVSCVTTLTTPYLIRSSDHVAAWFDRAAPRALREWMQAYSEWIGTLMRMGEAQIERRLLRKLAAQMILSLLLVTGIFIGMAFFYQHVLRWWPQFPGGINGIKAAAWLVAVLASFPMLVAVWRKLEVAGMLISEMSVNPDKAGTRTAALQSIVARTIVVVGTGVLIVLVLLLSATILPSWNFLILASIIVAGSGVLLYRTSVKLYARAQFALHDTFATPPDPAPAHHGAEVPPPSMHKARLRDVLVPEDSPAAGKLLSELRIDEETGAAIVGIERGDTRMLNPGPSEEVLAGDKILLVGDESQLEKAETILRPKADRKSDS